MKWFLHAPSFWPEHRDPWAWQRALRLLAKHTPLPSPWPCWDEYLKGQLSRRSVPGLYGLKESPAPPTILGVGFLVATDQGWVLEESAQPLLEAGREAFQEELADWLVRRSVWLRLALRGLAVGSWSFPMGVGVLQSNRHLRIGIDLVLPEKVLGALSPDVLLGELATESVKSIQTKASLASLSALHSPLYLLHALGWLNQEGKPVLPDHLAETLALESPALMLRRITGEVADGSGFVPFHQVLRRFWAAWYGTQPNGNLGTWGDQTFQQAFDTGSIEVDAWGPGQPRHGRGFLGDRERKLVRWTIHDDFRLSQETNDSEQCGAGAKHRQSPKGEGHGCPEQERKS